jgi:predicted TIM-barrel fold metal-dependent hydrolase
VLTRELIGVETLMWGNDYPHLDSTWPCSRDVRAEILRGVPEDEVAAMTRRNVARLYRLEVA